MGQLEVIFRIGLAHKLLVMANPSPIVASFAETGNNVIIEPPDYLPVTEHQKMLGALDRFTLRVRRECTDEQGRRAVITEFREFRILSDVAKVFWTFVETIRESDFNERRSVAGYPVGRAEEIQNNALVRTCDLECFYDGTFIHTIPLNSQPVIQITDTAWKAAQHRLSTGEEVPPPVSFALDAFYFAEKDPIRAIIMACAAWEIALRDYLANIAGKRDPAYLAASQQHGGIRPLEAALRAAVGGDLFHDYYGTELDAHFDHQRAHIRALPALRNKLVHYGRAAIPDGATLDASLAVLDAVEWLFGRSP